MLFIILSIYLKVPNWIQERRRLFSQLEYTSFDLIVNPFFPLVGMILVSPIVTKIDVLYQQDENKY